MASVMLPLFLPQGMTVDKFLRAVIGVSLFASAYMAEVVRGGLQAIPKGQAEGADSLGLSYWQKMRLIILPQALKLVIPGIVNTFIGLFQGYVAGVDHRHVRSARHRPAEFLGRQQLGIAGHATLRSRLCRIYFLAFLLRYVALFRVHGTKARQGPQTITNKGKYNGS